MIKLIQKYYFKKLKQNKISEPEQSCRFLVSYALKKDYQNVNLFQNYTCSSQRILLLIDLLKQRLNNVPIQYLVKKWHFRKINVYVQRPVLIPRQETEYLVDIALKKIQKDQKYFLEIGSGTGVISISLIKDNKQLHGKTIDIKQKCIDLTIKNIKLCLNYKDQKKIIVQKLDFQDLDYQQQYDFIISNPPYIKTNDIQSLNKQVRNFEDIDALNGGLDGLDIIKNIVLMSKYLVKQNGFVILECGEDHIQQLQQFIQNQSFTHQIELHKDQYEVERFMYYKIK